MKILKADWDNPRRFMSERKQGSKDVAEEQSGDYRKPHLETNFNILFFFFYRILFRSYLGIYWQQKIS